MPAADFIWTERYRPRELADLCLPARVMDKLRAGAHHNLLFYGSAGTGKTSAARILAGPSFKFINCSLQSGVDEVRNSISDFCMTASVIDGESSLKVVILDEFEGVSEQYFKALRGVMEQFHSTTRFIATTNYFTKVPDAIQSRFECVSFDALPEEEKEVKRSCMQRAYHVLKAEGMTINKEALVALVERYYPDIRRVIAALQSISKSGAKEIEVSHVERYRGEHGELFDLVCSKPDPGNNYKQLYQYASGVDDALRALGRDFIDYILEHRADLSKRIGPVLYEVNRHSYESRFAVDPFVTLLSLVFRLQQEISK